MIATVDIETYSAADIKQVGSYRYAQDESFEVLLFGYALDDAHPDVVNCLDLPGKGKELPEWFPWLFDKSVIKRAHNAAFEWWCLSELFGLSWDERVEWLQQWECSMVHALYCGLPGALGALGLALGQPQDALKDRQGRALIAYFCTPCKATKANGGRLRNMPQHDLSKWGLFVGYNRQDVIAERANDRALAAWPVPSEIMQQWRDDVAMEAYGVAVDMDLVQGALDCLRWAEDRKLSESRQITGLENPNSRAQLLDWLHANGCLLDTLTKDAVAAALKNEVLPKKTRRVLELRQQLGKSSNKKYQVLQDASGPDKRIRGCLQFYGAGRTGRWAGRLLQVQNLPRTYLADQAEWRSIVKLHDAEGLEILTGNIPDTLSQLIRTTLVPSPGCRFADADFSAIEARLIAWLAGEEWVLEVFRGSGKIYEATAARIFDVPFESIVKGNPNYKYRQRGKVATLALGYQGGVGAMLQMGGDQLGLDDAGLQDIVDRWRTQNPAIVRLWRKMQRSAVDTIRTGRPSYPRADVVFRLEASSSCAVTFLTMQLPSGRKLFYANPDITDDGQRITYWEQTNAGWTQSETYGGKLTENLTQAVGRDCLAFALDNLRAAGYRIVFHVHDEVVCEVPAREADTALDRIVDIMSRVPPWAQGLPLNAAGWVGDFFTKD